MTLELMTPSVLLSGDGHTQTCTNEERGGVTPAEDQNVPVPVEKPVHHMHQSHFYGFFFRCISITLIDNNSHLTLN